MPRPKTNPDAITTPTERKPRAKRKPRIKAIAPEATQAIVTFINIPLTFISPEDVLEQHEALALSNALYDAACSNPYINAIIANVTGIGGVGELAAVATAIIGKRISRRIQARTPNTENKQATALQFAGDIVLQYVATRTTPDTSGEHRERKDDTSAEDPNAEEIRNSANDQSRSTDMANVSGSAESIEDTPRRNGRRTLSTETEI